MSRKHADAGLRGPRHKCRLRLLCSVWLLCGAGLLGPPLFAADRYDPSLRFRTIATPHFFIHFHQGEEALAQRLAQVAEQVHEERILKLGAASSRERTHVILVDQTDLANGWASPLPFNTIEITAAAPRADDVVGNTDDWLRMVFAHEYTHILHLDRARGWIGGLRRVFGRAPPLFPNAFLPIWQIEGIATWSESDATGRGRLHAGDFRRILDAAARGGRFEPLDRASGGLVAWPDSHAPYAYGGYFHEYLARTHGVAKLRELTERTSGRVPYFGSGAFRAVFGRSLGDLWRDFERDTRARATETSASARVRRLTTHGFIVGAPRWSADGSSLFYSARNPHEFPALIKTDAATGTASRLATRVGGERTAAGPGVIIFDQLEYVRSVAVQSDLYELTLDNQRVRRLTRGARASDPDLASDGRRVACVVQRPGGRALALIDLEASAPLRARILLDQPETHYGAPRWSPDGRLIAVERWRRDAPSQIVVVHAATAATEVIVSSHGARNTAPDWTRDGRWIVFATDVDGGPMQLQAVEWRTLRTRALDRVANGAQAPAISPDGRTVAFVGYTADGFDIFSTELPEDVLHAPELSEGTGRVEAFGAERAPTASGTPYRPWGSLLPRFWTPVVEQDNDRLEVGAATGGLDALGRHAYGVLAAWGLGRSGRPDWQAVYVYDRWRPTVFVTASDEGSEFQQAAYRDQTVDTGMTLSFRRVRRVQIASASLHGDRETRVCAGCDDPGRSAVDRRAARLGWTFVNARQYGYSISAEDGVLFSGAIEAARAALGSTADATALMLQARAYPRLGPRHGVLALRAAGAASWGDARVARLFGAGGPAAEPPGGIGRDAVGLLRGYAEDAVVGRRAAAVNVDYRWPLVYVERGAGTWPVFVRSVHTALFVDAGHAWTPPRRFAAADVKVTAGVELAMDATVGYFAPITVAAGVAWRRDGAGRLPGGVAVFGRVGRAF
jgi:hypothetical protein